STLPLPEQRSAHGHRQYCSKGEPGVTRPGAHGQRSSSSNVLQGWPENGRFRKSCARNSSERAIAFELSGTSCALARRQRSLAPLVVDAFNHRIKKLRGRFADLKRVRIC